MDPTRIGQFHHDRRGPVAVARGTIGTQRNYLFTPAGWARRAFLFALLLGFASLAWSETGRLILKDGSVLRGDITRTDYEVILRNAAGEKRFSLEDVERVELDPIASRPAAQSAPSAPAVEPVDSQPSKFTGPQPPANLSARDILRLKLAEFPVDGPTDSSGMAIDFPRVRNEPPLVDVIERAIRAGADADPDWKSTLERGSNAEKLQLLLRVTGLRHMDRVQIRGDTQVFARYRKHVLPLIMRGCIKSGCHGGNNTHAMRFPVGVASSEAFAYTSFVVLDKLRTPVGPMLDRASPEDSGLLKYLMPPADPTAPVHPDVAGGKLIHPIRSEKDANYTAVLEWISSLKVKHPDYDLETPLPDWLRQPAESTAAASQPAISAPADDSPPR